MQSKLTLRLDDALIQRAKDYSEESGKSLSQLVAEYFTLLTGDRQPGADELPPVVRSLLGSMKGSKLNEEDFQRHLVEKYR